MQLISKYLYLHVSQSSSVFKPSLMLSFLDDSFSFSVSWIFVEPSSGSFKGEGKVSLLTGDKNLRDHSFSVTGELTETQ